MSPLDPDFDRFATSRAHQARAHRLIPGGAHTYAKGDDQMPEWMPVVVDRGEGAHAPNPSKTASPSALPTHTSPVVGDPKPP